MHNQLRDMGREVVRKESLDEPGKRSRLWFPEEALHVLKECTRTRNVKGLLLNFDQMEETLLEVCQFSIEAFAVMNKLRLLQIDDAHLVGDFKHLSPELRWLRCTKKLVVLDLSRSKISQVWDMWHQKKILVQQGLFQHLCRLCFHGSNIPDWFVPVQFSQSEERLISKEIQISFAEVAQPGLLNPDIEITGLIICMIFVFKKPVNILFCSPTIEVVVKKNDKTVSTSGECIEDIPLALLEHDQIYLRFFHEERDRFVHALKYGNQIQVSINPGRKLMGNIDVKKGGIYLVCNSKEDTTTMPQSTYKRMADILTSCGGFVGDGMSGKKEMLALDAIDFSISSCSVVEGEVNKLRKANEADDEWDVPPKPKKPKKDP